MCMNQLCVCVNKLCESMHSKARMTCYHFIHNYCAFILYTISYLRCMNVAVTKCHACHANSCGARQTQARHQSQPSAITPTPATQSEGPCHQVPHLPRKVKVAVTKCHACQTARRSPDPSAPPEPAQRHKSHTCHAK